MGILQEKLQFLLEKYSVEASAVLAEDKRSVAVNGTSYALLPWRNERRFTELKKIVATTVGNISHCKTMSLNPSSVSLREVMRRELDTAEFITGLHITEIFTARNGDTCSILCMTDSGAVFTLELSAALPQERAAVDKHEIITDRGTACDRSVDSQTPLSSVYVYGKDMQEYTDVDFELYGLSVSDIATVRQAFDIAGNPSIGIENNRANERLDMLISNAEYSAEHCVNVIL